MFTKHVLRLRQKATASDETFDYVKTDPVGRGEQWLIRSHSFENESGARGTIRGYIEGHGYKHWLWEQASPAEDTLYWFEENFILTEGERLCVRQASCTSGDIMQLLVNGEIEYLKED